MAAARQERRLAAIVSADMVGYSRLMSDDDAGTHARLKVLHAEVIDPAIAARDGRIVKTMGDGLLAEFASVTDALAAMLAMQRALADRSAGLATQQRIQYRVGIAIGDIIVDGADIFGDGVNIAARLQALAAPGGITVSDDAKRQVNPSSSFVFQAGGVRELKNIPTPIAIHHVVIADPGERPVVMEAPGGRAGIVAPSIAVLPFDNLSADPKQNILADGIVEDIITALSRLSWLHVIARNSTFVYKGEAVDVRRVARELSVAFVLEGSVRRADDRVRVSVQLVDADNATHIWAQNFDLDLTDIFALQDEVAHSVAGAIEPALSRVEIDRAARKPPDRLDAWGLHHRGLATFPPSRIQDNERAKDFFRQAIALEPSFGAPHASLALATYIDSVIFGIRPFSEAIAEASPIARRSVELDPNNAMSRDALAWTLIGAGDLDGAIAEWEVALRLNPNSAWIVACNSATMWRGGHEQALERLDHAIRLSPFDPALWLWLHWKEVTYYFMRDFPNAEKTARELIRLRPELHLGHLYCAMALAQQNRKDDARAALEHAETVAPDYVASFRRDRRPFMRQIDWDLIQDGLRRAGA